MFKERASKGWTVGRVSGLVVGFGLLAACGGGGGIATNTTAPQTTTTMAATITTTAAARTTAGATTRAATMATTRTTASMRTTATTRTTGTTPATGATPAPGAVAPGPGYQNLQALDNRREIWHFSGIAVGGVTGDVTVVYDFNGGNQRMVAQSGGNTVLEAYRIGGQLYTRNPLGGGFIAADTSNPLAQPVQQLFDLPKTILTNLIPPSADYTASGAEMVNGRQATKYTGNVTLANLGFINPSLQGQSGTSATTIWVTNDRDFIVATEANMQATEGGRGHAARARLDVTMVGEVPAITIP